MKILGNDVTTLNAKKLNPRSLTDQKTGQRWCVGKLEVTYVVLRDYRDVMRLFGASGLASNELLSMLSVGTVSELREA